MQRVLVAALAAVDALVAAAAGLVAVLAPFTIVWIAVFGDTNAWGALWPATTRVWQLGHLVPVRIDATDHAATLGIPDAGSAFWLSVAPLLFAAFTLFFAARSGRRAVQSGAPLIAVPTGIVVFALVATGVQLTSDNPVAITAAWQAILLPSAVYAVGAVAGAIKAGWNDGDGGVIDRIQDVVDSWGPAWRDVPTLIARGTSVVIVGLVCASAVLFTILVALGGGEVVTLFERTHADVVGATTLTLAQLAYLPTMLGWGVSWIAGPGFALGTDTAISPSGTSLGVVPGIPVFGILPEGGSGWFLLVALVPVALGALAGWIARRSYAEDWSYDGEGHEHYGPRVAIAVGIAVFSGAVAALIAAVSAGSMGPGRLADVGADAGPVALAVGLEALLGAAILLLTPMRRPLAWADVAEDDSNEVAAGT
ncbi:cell division protein PerM [Microbacterium gubbeenense]|uniref:cell division protein PerM n=1 Tax=Microbacterium gubbeenense TaxID=159896 RepID=UPI003F94E66A